jgi:5-oxoprolinase (ATP-hydrolysing)
VSEPWQLFIDTGGTFTDAIAISPLGDLSQVKVLSSSSLRGTIEKILDDRIYTIAATWSARADLLSGSKFRLLARPEHEVTVADFDPSSRQITLAAALPTVPAVGSLCEIQFDEDPPLLAARLLTGTAAGAQLPPLTMRLGTTLATNALLTRTGARLVQFVTHGFADLLTIGTQQRPALFVLNIEKPEILPAAVVEIDARVSADGTVLQSLDVTRLDEQIQALLADGFNSAAITLLHADRYPDHEQALVEHLRRAGFAHVSCSSDMARAVRLLPRASTAVVDAYLAPVVNEYLSRISQVLTHHRLLVMTSAGGLMGSTTVRPKDMLLSGPAGGVVGAASTARQAGLLAGRGAASDPTHATSPWQGILSFDPVTRRTQHHPGRVY